MATHDTNLRGVVTLDDRMTPVLKGLEKQFAVAKRHMGSGFKELAGMAKAAGAAVAGLATSGAGVFWATTAAADSAAAMDAFVKQTGVAAERLQAWQAVAVASGHDADEFAEALRDMNIELSDAATGNKESLAALMDKLGISMRDAKGEIKSADAVFLDFADAIARQTDPMIQYRMAIEAFGEDTGVKLLPVLQKGSKAFRESEAAMKAAGTAITQEQIDKLMSFRTEWNRVTTSMSTLKDGALSELAPSFGKLADSVDQALVRVRPLLNAKFAEWGEKIAASVESIPWDAVINKIDALVSGGDKLEKEFGFVGTAIRFVGDNLQPLLFTYFGAKGAMALWQFGGATMQVGGAMIDIAKSAPLLVQKVAAIGPMMMTVVGSFGKVIGGAKALGTALTGALGPWGIAIAAAVAAGVLLYENWDTISAKCAEFVEKFKATISPWVEWVREKLDAVMGFFEDIGDGIASAGKAVVDAIPDWMKPDSWSEDNKKEAQRPALSMEQSAAMVRAQMYTPSTSTKSVPGFYTAQDAAAGASSASGFYQTMLGPSDADRANKAIGNVQKGTTQEVQGEVVVRFEGAPQGTRVERARSSGGVGVGTEMNFRTGENAYKPNW